MTAWWAVDMRVTRPDHTATIAEWLVAYTQQALEERPDGSLVATVTDQAAADDLIRQSKLRWGPALADIEGRPVDDVDWSVEWKEGLAPRRIGGVTICPSWLAHVPTEAEAVVLLDPESAFGSGEHGSTRAALILLDRQLRPGDTVLDLGSGSGILALAAVKRGAARAVGIEVDPEAIVVADRNAQRNDAADRVAFVEGDAALLAPLLGPADLILSNILPLSNAALLDPMRESLTPSGKAIFSGMEEHESTLFLPTLEAHGWDAVDTVTDDGWWAVTAHPC